MYRSSSGCWTCRLRRKKCDEQRPVCDGCVALQITCNYDADKPAWMDSGVRQEAMAEQLKHKIKQQAPYRRRGRRVTNLNHAPISDQELPSLANSSQSGASLHDSSMTPSDATFSKNPGSETLAANKTTAASTAVCKQVQQMRPFGQSDSVLLMFYLERIMPFLFPFYRPSLLQGGRAWILDLVISSPVVRLATLCQSSYFFALAHGTTADDRIWGALLKQTSDTFNMLRKSIEVIESTSVNGHMHGNVRTMAAVMQLQRFEIASSCFDNCQAHLSAALTIFGKVIDIVGTAELASSFSTFQAILSLLGPPLATLPALQAQVSSAEQAAFCFCTGLLLFDDIIASTALRERPQLYDYHYSLLCKGDGIDSVPSINLESMIGCQNWVLEQIGEIAVLDAWKKQCEKLGNLDVAELVHRAMAIKKMLQTYTTRFETHLVSMPNQESSLLDDMFAAEDYNRQVRTIAQQSLLVTRIWAHATFLYLSVIVSGWQPANADVRYHVGQVLELLTNHVSPPALLRTMAWPLCVVGCLTESAQKARIRDMIDSLRPASRFSTVRRSLDIIEKVWQDRAMGYAGDFASYFRSDGNLVLLV